MLRGLLLFCCGFLLFFTAALTAVRLLGLDDGTYLALPMAGFPYAVAATIVLTLVVLAASGRLLLVLAIALVVTQLFQVVPRFIPHNTTASSVRLRVAAANTDVGKADPQTIMALVRSEQIDVLSLEEFTAAGVQALDRAGIGKLLPYHELHPEIDSSIYSRYPLVLSGLLKAATKWQQPTAQIMVGGRTVTIVAVHTYYPPGDPQRWAQDLQALGGAAKTAGKDTVFLGDFNATLDHATMRNLLADGLIDSHAELGRGWAPTWPSVLPVFQLDHVLHGSGLTAVRAGEQTIPGSDHRAVFAELALNQR
ncbi:endonuclease/exonuclease/phosphatase family protein [Fodinicola feengrottensis]|uniref:Endonuclease/exonuclease/phosphatase family protein n=1 Tax=Fodinicola feengrottensis TaxID=435914 RepID=A0ABP4RU60_9ACTN